MKKPLLLLPLAVVFLGGCSAFTAENQQIEVRQESTDENISEVHEIVPMEESLLSDEEKQMLFKDLIAAERQAAQEAEALYPLNSPDITLEDIKQNGALSNELREKYTEEISAQYGLTVDQAMAIVEEAWEEGWAME